MKHSDYILVLDFGSQYTQLIARRIREQNVFSEIHPFNYSVDEIIKNKPKGIILSGGPSSVYSENAPLCDKKIFELGIPILGICYGLQLISFTLGGEVAKSNHREFGRAELKIKIKSQLFNQIENLTTVWMSHGDKVEKIPNGFDVIAETTNAPFCAIENIEKKIFGVQFHPEVVHSEKGTQIIKNFIFDICKSDGGWNSKSFIENAISEIRNTVGKQKVICALSGGVDSSVTALLLHKAIGEQLVCIHIDNGLMRKNESVKVVDMFKNKFHIPLTFIDASVNFLSELKNVEDPEKKRKIIGRVFIETFEKTLENKDENAFLAQGTLYPDVIESVSFKGPSATIKTHHNVGGLPENMKLKLIEPFKELFKDEVRAIGYELGLDETFIERHPFPGPGLAIRILGDVTLERLEILRAVDEIFIGELKNENLYKKVWQAFAVLLPVKSVGVMGDERTYENTIALRAVTSIDGMTADWAHLPYEFLGKVSNKIINQVRGVNRVVYDISSKPPATIEWE